MADTAATGRVTDRSVFRGFDRDAPRAWSGPLALVRNDAVTSDQTIVAFAIPRAVGPAVVRNRLRRQLRVVMRELAENRVLRPKAYLVVVRPQARGTTMEQLRGWLGSAAEAVEGKVRPDHGDHR